MAKIRKFIAQELVDKRLDYLHSGGFDDTYYDEERATFVIKCSQCVALVILDVPCHEQGCPNRVKEVREYE